MSRLTLYTVAEPGVAIRTETDPVAIADALSPWRIRFERLPTVSLPPETTTDELLGLYRAEINDLKTAYGYRTIDAIRVKRGAENAAAMRAKFLSEHTHAEDENRFFVEGEAAFYLRNDTHIARVICGQGDMISVPANTRHWFDMGADPEFSAIRFFVELDGWIGHFTGDAIADQVPRIDG